MGLDRKPALTLANIKKTVQPLFEDIIQSPGSYSVDTNPLVKPIHHAWQDVQADPNADPALKNALSTPESFVRAVAPKTEKVTQGQMARGLRHRVGMYVMTEVEEPAIETVYKTGWLKGKRKPPASEEWQMTESDSHKDIYVRRSVLDEVKTSPAIEIYGSGFHATTSAALTGIERRKAIASSSIVRKSGDQLLTGEVFGSQNAHDQVFVYTDKIADGYGTPGWFEEYGVVMGISIEKQREHLAKQGKEFGLWSSSDGAQIGEEVPLENVTVISASATKLNEVKKWAAKNCPNATIVSREALHLKYGK